MIIICNNCGEKYDSEYYPKCPFCGFDQKGKDCRQEVLKSKNLTDNSIDNLKNSQNDIAIKDYFPERKYLKFVSYCHNNGLYHLSDLYNFNFDNLYSIPSYGKGKIQSITERLENRPEFQIKADGVDAQIFCNDSPIKTMPIDQYFYENKYNIFVKYCKNNNLNILDDLFGFDFQQLCEIPGLGKGKIKAIIDKLNEYSEVRPPMNSDITKDVLYSFIHPTLFQEDISLLSIFDITNHQIANLKKAGYLTIGSLEKITKSRLSTIVGYNIQKFINCDTSLQNSALELLNDILSNDKANDNKGYVSTLFKSEGYTLQEIGDLLDLTRERVRQLISTYLRYLSPLVSCILKPVFVGKNYIYTQEVGDIVDNEEYEKIISYWCRKNEKLSYLSFANVYVYTDKELDSEINNLAKDAENFVNEGINLSDHLEELEEITSKYNAEYINPYSFINFMLGNGYKQYGNYLVKGRQSYGYLCAKIVGEKFPDGIKLSDKNELKILRKYALSQYGDININDSDRAFSTRVANFLILRGRGTYTTEDHIQVDMGLLDTIKEYIDSQKLDIIYYSELYSRFEGMINALSNIDNYNFLHGVLKLYFANEYDFSARDYISKKNKTGVSGNIKERLKNYIISKNRAVTKQEIIEIIPGITNIRLALMVANDSSLFQWDFNEYSTVEIFNFEYEDKVIIKSTLDCILKKMNGCCTDKLLYSELLKSNQMVMSKFKINNSLNLFFLCSKLFGNDYDFRRPNICKKGILPSISLETVILHILGNPISFNLDEYLNITKKLMLSEVSSSSVLSVLKKNYIQTAEKQYLLKDKFILSDFAINKIKEDISRQMEKGFVSLNTYDFSHLPDVEFEWNSFLLRSIIECYIHSLKIIEPISKDRRYEKGIVVLQSSQIQSYDELIAVNLKKNNIKEISEYKLLSYLIINGLAIQVIPHDLYCSDKFSIKDGCFTVK